MTGCLGQETSWLTGDPYLAVVLTANGALQRTMSAWYQQESIDLWACK